MLLRTDMLTGNSVLNSQRSKIYDYQCNIKPIDKIEYNSSRA